VDPLPHPFRQLGFSLVNLTDAMGVINLSGPNTRKVLAKVLDIDLSNDAFPFSGYREFTIKDTIFVRAMRLGFVGELSLRAARSLILHSGGLGYAQDCRSRIRDPQLRRRSPERAAHGKMPCHPRLRSPNSAPTCWTWAWAFSGTAKKPMPGPSVPWPCARLKTMSGRLKLVGIRMEDDTRPARDGALIVDSKVRGYVATMRKSFTTGEAIGMALVESQLADKGTRLEIFEDECNGVRLYARVIDTPFYDPKGERMKN
jgi:sarcosine oxidase subunit alpha